MASAVRGVAGTEEGRAPLDVGAGGDRTMVVDRVAEDAVVAACERLHADGARFLLRSEELGDRRFGADTPILLVDPVDGSRNAMTGLPFFCTALALLEGDTLGDTVAGVVRSLAWPGVFSAVRGGGAYRDGRPLHPLPVELGAGDRIPMLLVEGRRPFGSTRADGVDLTPLSRQASRVRVLGSSALSLCQAATGAASALVAPDGMRAYDCAAGLLLLAEVGAVATTLEGEPLAAMPAAFGVRSPVVASLSPRVHERALALLRR